MAQTGGVSLIQLVEPVEITGGGSGGGDVTVINTTANPVPTTDTTDREFTSVATTITAMGDTTVYTPAAGKRVRIYWVYAINDPNLPSTKITIKLGTQVYYVAWAISKRQQFTGAIDAPLVVNLSVSGNVAFTVFLQEI